MQRARSAAKKSSRRDDRGNPGCEERQLDWEVREGFMEETTPSPEKQKGGSHAML